MFFKKLVDSKPVDSILDLIIDSPFANPINTSTERSGSIIESKLSGFKISNLISDLNYSM